MLSLSQPGGQVYQSIAVIPGSSLASGNNSFVINPANWEVVKSTRIFFPINFVIENNQADPLTGCTFLLNNNLLNDAFNTLTTPNFNTIVYCLPNPGLNHYHAKSLVNDLEFNFSIAGVIPGKDIRVFIHYSIV